MTDQLVQGPRAARSTLGGNPFPPIADYGFLSDYEVSALVAEIAPPRWTPSTGRAPATDLENAPSPLPQSDHRWKRI